MTLVAILLVLLVAAFVQGMIPAAAVLGMAKAPLILSAVIYYALTHGRVAMVCAAFLGGIIHDSLGFTPLGCSSFCFCLIGMAIQSSRELLFKDSLLTVSALTSLGAALLTLATWTFLVMGDFERVPELGGSGWLVWIKAGGVALLAWVAAPPVFALARGLDSLIGGTESSTA